MLERGIPMISTIRDSSVNCYLLTGLCIYFCGFYSIAALYFLFGYALVTWDDEYLDDIEEESVDLLFIQAEGFSFDECMG